MTRMSRAKRLISCCGRWNTKFHRRCEKQIRLAGFGSLAKGSALDLTGTPTRVSILRLNSVICVAPGMNRPPGITGSQDCHRYPEFIGVALEQSPRRPIE